MNLKNKRFRRIPATQATPHRRSEQAPQPPHAATVPDLTEVYAGGYRYQLNWPEYLRRKAGDKRAEAADLNTQVRDLIARAARCCAEADDMERIAAVVEADDASTPPLDAVVRPGPAVATDELVNGEQPGFGGEREPMRSTDPDARHNWRVTHHPVDAEPYVQLDNLEMSDAQLEAIAEESGERATITYAREVPWQEGHRHAIRLDLRAREGDGSFVYERIADGRRSSAVADTLTVPQVPEVAR